MSTRTATAISPREMRWLFDKIDAPPRRPACWNWTGSRDRWGYALMRIDGKTRVIHRLVYEHFYGPVPPGLELDHTCKNPSCVNPSHLEPVTHLENLLRGDTIIARHAQRKAQNRV
jgi:HNH endonuclease